MPSATEEFFAALPERGAGVLPPEIRGTLRFDLSRDGGTDQWFVTLGDAKVSTNLEENPTDRKADCLVKTAGSVFDALATGRGNVVALTLANRMTVQGYLPLILLFRRFFPPAPGARDPRTLASRGAQ